MRKLTLISLLICIILGINLLYYIFKREPALQMQEQIYLSMYAPLSEHIDLKSAQITHKDATPVKVTLTAFDFSFFGTTEGYVGMNKVEEDMYLGYRSPNNATPTVREEVVLHELYHLVDIHHDFQKYCQKKDLESIKECGEEKAYDFTHLFYQVRALEKQGWLKIEIDK